jgi:cytosine/adenosine deaminase-related metal-dependent hydrolase
MLRSLRSALFAALVALLSTGVTEASEADTVYFGGVCEPEPYMASQTLPVEQALRLMTWEGAYALGLQSVVGSLKPGKLADLVLLSGDPLTVGPDELKDIQVLATAVGGEWLFCADGVSLCPP